MKTIYLAGGCFWGTQQYLRQFRGVVSTLVGYANGRTEAPSYEDVCHKDTGHAETVRVEYDETVLPTAALLEKYFLSIDPLSVNRQGGDAGTQYRTGIYYDDESLLPDILAAAVKLEAGLGRKCAVELLPLTGFWPAEDYHQDYLLKHPDGYCHIPKSLLHMEA
jgi:methionine-S-sulfoxide reductase